MPATARISARCSGRPTCQLEPTGEKATIAGQRAERFRFSETLQFRCPKASILPPDFPSSIDLTGDLWSTDGVRRQRATRPSSARCRRPAAIPGVEALTAGGRFPLRIALGRR